MNGYALVIAVGVVVAIIVLLLIGHMSVVRNTEDHKTIRHEIKVGTASYRFRSTC
jgi:hypothetical protein